MGRIISLKQGHPGVREVTGHSWLCSLARPPGIQNRIQNHLSTDGPLLTSGE